MAIDFDGTGDSVTLGTMNFPSSNPAGNFSCGGWVNIDVTGGTENFMSKASGGTTATQEMTFQKRSLEELRLYMDNGAVTTTGTGLLSTGTWHHVLFTYGGSNGRIYLDGTERSSGAHTTGVPSTATGTRLASQGNADNREVNGRMANWAVWSRKLTATEITYLAGNIGRTIANGRDNWWPLDAGADGASVTAVKDVHGVQNSTAINGTPAYTGAPVTKPAPQVS